MKLRIILIIIDLLALICTCIWLYQERSWSAGSSFFVALAGLVVIICTKTKENDAPQVIMKQKGGENSKNYQSQGDMTINK